MGANRLSVFEFFYIVMVFRKEQKNQLFRIDSPTGKKVLVSPFAYMEASRFLSKKQALLQKKTCWIRCSAKGFPLYRPMRFPEAIAELDGQITILDIRRRSAERKSKQQIKHIEDLTESYRQHRAEHHAQDCVLKKEELQKDQEQQLQMFSESQALLLKRKERCIAKVNAKIESAMARSLFRIHYYYHYALENLSPEDVGKMEFRNMMYDKALVEALCEEQITPDMPSEATAVSDDDDFIVDEDDIGIPEVEFVRTDVGDNAPDGETEAGPNETREEWIRDEESV